ncbi:efflux transporter outer membrane subunit [Methylocapsa sp. S129]|uniref:efflux transporter outer membrane subunit n=1 Tax=Methylocapsa sp. S129 TaxID=1641869 RepID=UPI00131C1816|nr:efflux transporter outer membrane subunit [Methylocapsa sp. S129]
MSKKRIAAVAVAASVLAACNVGPDFTPPDSGLPQARFANPAAATSAKEASPSSAISRPPDPTWWKAFGDPALTSLEARVATANLDLKTATLRIAESRFQRSAAASAELPSLEGTAKYQRELYSQNGIASLLSGLLPSGGAAPAPIGAINEYTTGFDASWELDLWGRVRRQVEAADAQVEASEDQRRDTLVSILAEVARDYIELRGAQALLGNANENLKIERDLLDLTRTRQEKGLTTGLDVENAAAQVEAVRAQIPGFEQQEAQQINALSLLLDLPPNGLRAELARAKAVPPTPARVPIGIPSELARRRPDIRRAEDQLHAETADIGVAVASFYPTVQLNGTLVLDSLTSSNLFKGSSLQYLAGPSLSLPIFEGGKLKAMLELSKAQQQEAAIAYRKAVLQAWHDVVNALIAYRTEQQKRSRLASQVEHSQQALTLARARYNDGVADFTTVLDTARTVLQAQQQFVQSTVNVSVDLVQLYKALGGGWEPTYPNPATASPVEQAQVDK